MLRSHRRLTKEQRYSILSEHIDGGISVSELSRKYQINPVTIYSWKRAMKENDNDSLDSKELHEEIVCLFVGLLDCWIVGLLDYWIVGLFIEIYKYYL